MFTVNRKSKVAIEIDLGDMKAGDEQEFLLISDLHYDSVKCERKLLKRHLEQAKEKGAGIIINGDLFDAMQSRNDRRRAKGALRPELLNTTYFNGIVDELATMLEPYSDLIVLVLKGNHETAVERHCDINLLSNLQYRLMATNPKMQAVFGLYESFVKIKGRPNGVRQNTFQWYFHHGSGGGAAVTHGTINFARLSEMIEGPDLFSMGHTHIRIADQRNVIKLNRAGELVPKKRWFLRTGSYKKDDVGEGWAKEKNMSPGALGGWWIKFYYRDQTICWTHYPTD